MDGLGGAREKLSLVEGERVTVAYRDGGLLVAAVEGDA
jgi:hypothetical protein